MRRALVPSVSSSISGTVRVAGKTQGGKRSRIQDKDILKPSKRQRRTAALFIFPAAAVLTIITIGPLLYSLCVSLTGWILTVPGSDLRFVGFENYRSVLTSAPFWKALQITLTYAVTTTAIEVVLGVIFALMLNEQFIGRGIVRGLMLIPLTLTPAVVGMFWKLLYDEQQGVFNFFVVSAGFDRIHWLSHGLALVSVIITDIWQSTPFLMLIVLAGLQAMDQEMVEAAKIDGASGVQIFKYLTIPHLLPYLVIGIFFRLLDAMKDFDKIYLLTQGGPGNETETLSIYIYDTGFKVFEVGKTSAMAWLMALISLMVFLPLLWAFRKQMSAERR
jgi:ABC-type sugar transport system permease subunit